MLHTSQNLQERVCKHHCCYFQQQLQNGHPEWWKITSMNDLQKVYLTSTQEIAERAWHCCVQSWVVVCCLLSRHVTENCCASILHHHYIINSSIDSFIHGLVETTTQWHAVAKKKKKKLGIMTVDSCHIIMLTLLQTSWLAQPLCDHWQTTQLQQ